MESKAALTLRPFSHIFLCVYLLVKKYQIYQLVTFNYCEVSFSMFGRLSITVCKKGHFFALSQPTVKLSCQHISKKKYFREETNHFKKKPIAFFKICDLVNENWTYFLSKIFHEKSA